MDEQHDIVVVGTGVAGTAAAVAALEQNADLDLALVERAPEGEHGGNSRWTGAYMRLQGDGSPVDGFLEDAMTFSKGKSDRELMETLADEAKPTIDWLREAGVEFRELQPEDSVFPSSNHVRLTPIGDGLAVVTTLLDRAERLGATVYYETTAERLTTSERGDITGLIVRGADGTPGQIDAGTVVLAAGGFEGNNRMLSEYVDGVVEDLDPIAPGGEFNKGEGIEMAEAVGAKLTGQFKEFHAEPDDARTDAPDSKILSFSYGILVNKDGERFVDEGGDRSDELFEYVGRRIYDQPGQVAYLLADQKFWDVPGIEQTMGTPLDPIEVEPDYASDVDPLESTLRNLGEEVEIDVETLLETVERYNDAVDDGEFDPHTLDGKQADVDPPKSNWAQPLDKPPFIAYPVGCANVFTFGGLAIDTDGRVLNTDDRPIPGLYAAGEITGLYYHKYPGATSVLRGLVFGRLAGQHATDRMVPSG
jgi:tricarballylate dehydrogenase